MELTPYRLPGGRIVMVDATAAKDARIIGFTLKGGEVVDAIQVSREEAEEYARGFGFTLRQESAR